MKYFKQIFLTVAFTVLNITVAFPQQDGAIHEFEVNGIKITVNCPSKQILKNQDFEVKVEFQNITLEIRGITLLLRNLDSDLEMVSATSDKEDAFVDVKKTSPQVVMDMALKANEKSIFTMVLRSGILKFFKLPLEFFGEIIECEFEVVEELAEPGPDLAVSKIAVDTDLKNRIDSAFVGDTINYVITVWNEGDAEALLGILFDSMTHNQKIIDVSCILCFSSVTLANNNAFSAELPPMMPGDTLSFLVEAVLCDTGQATNFVAVGDIADATLSNNFDSASVKVLDRTADLSVLKFASTNDINEGDTITFNIQVSNQGPHQAQNVLVEDILPESLEFIDVICSNSGTSHVSSNKVTCSWEKLPVGKSETMTIRALAT
ncbi:MAG: DUF11 domain-containing protein, partial [Saprospiraceae bacterium]|nr:DUF11 domain-containing protein [Saprospiraceae bacterium]